jgi:adenine deaminase
MNGGNAVVSDGRVLSEMPLPIAGLMSDLSAEQAAAQNHAVRAAVYELGVADGVEPFMNMAFISLSVIPHIKMTTKGLIDVDKQEIVSLFA